MNEVKSEPQIGKLKDVVAIKKEYKDPSKYIPILSLALNPEP